MSDYNFGDFCLVFHCLPVAFATGVQLTQTLDTFARLFGDQKAKAAHSTKCVHMMVLFFGSCHNHRQSPVASVPPSQRQPNQYPSIAQSPALDQKPPLRMFRNRFAKFI